AYSRVFDQLDEKQRGEVLIGLSTGKVSFDDGLPVRVFWTTVYQTVMGRDVFGSDLRRQPQQGGLAADRFPRGDRGSSRERREISRQALPCRPRQHRGHELRGARWRQN